MTNSKEILDSSKLSTFGIIHLIISLCWLACKIIWQVMWYGHKKYDGADPFEQWSIDEQTEHAFVHAKRVTFYIEWYKDATHAIVRLLLAIAQAMKERK